MREIEYSTIIKWIIVTFKSYAIRWFQSIHAILYIALSVDVFDRSAPYIQDVPTQRLSQLPGNIMRDLSNVIRGG